MRKLFLLCIVIICLNGIAQTTDPLKDFSMTDGFNAIEFAHKMFVTNDFDRVRNYTLETPSLSYKKDYETKTFLSADRTDGLKERFWMSRENKNNPSVDKLSITVSKWTDENISNTFSKLGYTEISSDSKNVLGSQVVTRIYQNTTTSTEATLTTTKTSNRVKKEIKFFKISSGGSSAQKKTNQIAKVREGGDNQNAKQTDDISTPTTPQKPSLPKVNEKKFKVKNVEFSMRFVPCGSFTMGKDNNTVKVELSNNFWVSETEVTTGLYDVVMDTNIGGTGMRAVECTWLNAIEFIRRLNIITGYNFRMITEAEWEYTARYGNGNKKYSGGNNPEDVLNSEEVKDSKPGALNKPNYLGIYGMSNKTSEWCYDIYKEKYPSKPQRNYQGPRAEDMIGKEHNHVVRSGGAMYYRQNSETDLYHRSSEYEGLPVLGIRLALYDNDVNNKNPQQVIEKRKVNLPAGMPVKWKGTGVFALIGKSIPAISANIYIKDERHRITANKELEGKVGYGFVDLRESSDKGLYIIEKIVITGKNTFTITIVPKDGGQRKQLALTYVYKTSTWKLLECKSSTKIFNNATFSYID